MPDQRQKAESTPVGLLWTWGDADLLPEIEIVPGLVVEVTDDDSLLIEIAHEAPRPGAAGTSTAGTTAPPLGASRRPDSRWRAGLISLQNGGLGVIQPPIPSWDTRGQRAGRGN